MTINRKITKGLFRLVTMLAFVIYAGDQILSGQIDSSGIQSDQFIKVEKLNNETIIIRMGYDAVTAIATQKGIVVIDAGISTGLTAKYRKIIEKEFQRNDIACLINTHGHPDHTGGNRVFADCEIIGHEKCLNEISNQWKDPDKVKTSLNKIVNDYDKELQSLMPGTNEWENAFCQKIRYQCAYNDVLNNYRITSPNVTFRDSLDIDMGDVKFNILYFGKGHSESDIIIHIPGKKILMVGDLFSKYGRPGIRDANKQYADRWLNAVKWIENRWSDIDIVINGHGDVLPKEDLLSFNSYVRRSKDNR